MLVSERPQLRPYLAAAEDVRDARFVIVWDRLGISRLPQRLTRQEYFWLQMCDGRRTLQDIQVESMRRLGAQVLPLEVVTTFLERMKRALFLDGPEFRERVDVPVRRPACLGSYEGDPEALRRQVRRLFLCSHGPGLPRNSRPDGQIRAALLPHIDYGRGGPSYAWGFREIVECSDAALFVIIGTSHHSSQRFTLTRKAFATPLGITPIDQDFIDRLVRHHGPGLFDDELGAHLPEWSIELEVVFLQYLYEGCRPIRIVPLVVGSFQDCVASGCAPTQREEINRMVQALRRAEAETPEPICYIISGDLAHIGPRFGDPDLSRSFLERSRAQDQAILQQIEAANPQGYFGLIVGEKDRRRICGLPPIYTALEALRPARGRVLHYDQYVHPRGHESVSFASAAFYR